MHPDLSTWTPRKPPGLISLHGRFAAIVPCDPGAHGPALWAAFGERNANAMMRYFPDPPFADAADFSRWLAGNPDRGWATQVFVDAGSGAVCGMGSFMRTDAANGVTEIGAIVHGPAMARSAMATEVHYLLARHVFDDLGYRRYEWKLDNRNEPSHRAAQRLGFIFEGVFRQHMVANGENRDTAWYAMIDRDWPRLKAALEAWLDPVNFDRAGRQKRRLKDIRGETDGRTAQG